MGVIQNFQKRQLALAVKSGDLPEKLKAEVKKNAALTLLAQLLQVPENEAIETAEKYIASNITFFADFADEPEKIVNITDIEEHEAVKEELAADIENAADSVQNAASDVENSAENVNSAASNIENSADDLAYTASDINNATEELKEATAEIKKPLAAQKSSSSEKVTKPKSSTKK
jgi:methyl-accepting chemotaxis protein